ncbi:MAG: Gfo/Idh/MocA family oxidoreductase [Symbiopectobacterium sp.]|uniref:Gfo/Idh/MocA family oxidoreductase n=1 Tax=Symbiopectobacterium sp. TaxID=2952789 RepID=UPI0039E82B51
MKRNKRITRLMIIGCGPHFIDRYSEVLIKQRPDIEIAIVVDLERRKDAVMRAMAAKGLSPERYIFFDEAHRNFPPLDEIRSRLNHMPELVGVDAALICTEPKAHLAYALWSTEQGLDIFMDKPITALTHKKMPEQLRHEFLCLLKAQQLADVRFVVSCERRMQIGYHYIDLVARLARLNCRLLDVDMADPVLKVTRVRHQDLGQVLKPETYHHMGIYQDINHQAIPYGCGELDITLTGHYQHQQRFRMGFCLQLLETSVSARHVPDEPPGTGRIRQETVHIHLGNLCSIRVVSDSLHKLTDTAEKFDITIALNPQVAAGEPIRKIDRAELSEKEPQLPITCGLNVFARRAQLLDFLAGGEACSPLASHADTLSLLVKTCQAMRALPNAEHEGAVM